jgi:hypothetical protein
VRASFIGELVKVVQARYPTLTHTEKTKIVCARNYFLDIRPLYLPGLEKCSEDDSEGCNCEKKFHDE